MLYILAVIHLADLHGTTPDKYEPIYAYETLAECWTEAEEESAKYEHEEAIVICLPEQ